MVWRANMVWSASKVRRRLGIPSGEVLLAWAPADERGMRVPYRPTAVVRRHRPYVALTDGALWLVRGGVAWRVGLEDVVLASSVTAPEGAPGGVPDAVPDGALRVDLVRGDPLVLLVVDGGVFQDRLVREIRAFERDLQLAAADRLGPVALPPGLHVGAARSPSHPSWRAAGPQPGEGGDHASGGGSAVCTGPVGPAGPNGPDGLEEAHRVVHDAELIVRRELRRVLTDDRPESGRRVR